MTPQAPTGAASPGQGQSAARPVNAQPGAPGQPVNTQRGAPRPGLGLSWKIFLWCLALVAVFSLTLALVFMSLREISQGTGQIVRVNYRTLEQSERLIQDLFDLLEDQKRFAILEKEEYRQAAQEDLARYRQGVEAMLAQGPQPREQWTKLERGIKSLPAAPAAPLIAEETVHSWLDALTAIQQIHRQDMAQELLALEQQGQAARRLGLTGLLIAGVVALGGSILLALYLGRALGRLRRGIVRVGGEGQFEPIALDSGDELGELARAFNRMGQRLQEEERLRAEFISVLSHEVRTPLTSIREAVNLVREGVLGPVNQRQAQFLEVSSQECVRLSGLLNQLMQVSSLEARDLTLSLAPTSAAGLWQEALARLAPSAAAKGIALEPPPAGQDLTALADAGQVGQVLLNLLGNAIKYAPEGSQVRLSLERQGDQAVLGVHDQGPGIPPEEQQYVFQKYYRGRALGQNVDGVGLGLAISQRVAQAHGGRLWLESQPGQGSSFFLALPLAQ